MLKQLQTIQDKFIETRTNELAFRKEIEKKITNIKQAGYMTNVMYNKIAEVKNELTPFMNNARSELLSVIREQMADIKEQGQKNVNSPLDPNIESYLAIVKSIDDPNSLEVKAILDKLSGNYLTFRALIGAFKVNGVQVYHTNTLDDFYRDVEEVQNKLERAHLVGCDSYTFNMLANTTAQFDVFNEYLEPFVTGKFTYMLKDGTNNY